MPNREDLIYLAGLIDGDGCFNIGKCRNTFVPRIMIVNTNEEIMSWLKDTFGGDVSKTKVKGKPNWKPRYTWRISHKRALELGDSLVDYLKIKAEQALLFRVWFATRDAIPLFERKPAYDYLSSTLTSLNRKGAKYALA